MENQGGADGAQIAEELAQWRSSVVAEQKARVGKDYSGARFQSRCFAVEWRGSVLLDKEVFLRELRDAVGGDASFMLEIEGRKSRVDYFAVVRVDERMRCRDWRKKLMFGHGGDVEGEGPFMRVQVPRRGSEEGTRDFVLQMVRKCDTYPDVFRYRQAEMMREHSKAYPRPGRKKKGGMEA